MIEGKGFYGERRDMRTIQPPLPIVEISDGDMTVPEKKAVHYVAEEGRE